jgi:hypothetical protein
MHYEYRLFLNDLGYYQTDIYRVDENGKREWKTLDYSFTKWGAKRRAEKGIKRLLGPAPVVETYRFPPRQKVS